MPYDTTARRALRKYMREHNIDPLEERSELPVDNTCIERTVTRAEILRRLREVISVRNRVWRFFFQW